MKRLILRLFAAYSELVDKRPLLTQIVTAGTLVTVGDILAQTTIEKKKKYDFRRTAVMSTCGFFYFGPLVAAWFTAVNKMALPVIFSVALDQFVITPPLLCGFFTVQTLLNGKSLSTAISRIKNEVPGIIKMNWMVWIPSQTINFGIVPFQYRMLFCQIVALFWNSYLSNRANRTIHKDVYVADGREKKAC
uniref:protein Mpv17-like n=1 Tax=Styela clava TaxID=7725 RepID=UPI00193A2F86|nr:protein Mpv17-like [Styela clava]